MDVSKIFGTDSDLEASEGIDLDFGSGLKVTIHRAGGANRKFEEASRRILAPYRTQINAETIDSKTARNLQAKIYAESVVVGWEGLERDGEVVPYSRANAERILADFPELLAAIQRAAENAATFRRTTDEADAGNSAPDSAGN